MSNVTLGQYLVWQLNNKKKGKEKKALIFFLSLFFRNGGGGGGQDGEGVWTNLSSIKAEEQ